MRRMIVTGVLIAILAVNWVPPAHAGRSTDIALGLASFAVFNQVVGVFAGPVHYPRREVVYVTRPAVVYTSPAPVVYASPAPVVVAWAPAYASTVVQYPHGRYELQWNGYQYAWVWIPAVPVPPPPMAPPPLPPAP